jgi:hypothetical protein
VNWSNLEPTKTVFPRLSSQLYYKLPYLTYNNKKPSFLEPVKVVVLHPKTVILRHEKRRNGRKKRKREKRRRKRLRKS